MIDKNYVEQLAIDTEKIGQFLQKVRSLKKKLDFVRYDCGHISPPPLYYVDVQMRGSSC